MKAINPNLAAAMIQPAMIREFTDNAFVNPYNIGGTPRQKQRQAEIKRLKKYSRKRR